MQAVKELHQQNLELTELVERLNSENAMLSRQD